MRLTDLVLTIPLLILAAVVGRTLVDLRRRPFLLALVLGAGRLDRRSLDWFAASSSRCGRRSSSRRPARWARRRHGSSSGTSCPTAIGTIIVNATLTISAAILLETALSFLGFGVQAPDTSLGLLISTYQNAFSTRPWLFWWPGLFIIVIALSVNFIGDGLRDAFDPKQTRVRA